MSYEKYIGQKYNLLTITNISKKDKKPICDARCDCGEKLKDISLYYITGGRKKHCGSPIHKESFQKFVGQKYNLLTIIKIITKRDEKENRCMCVARCECGDEKEYIIRDVVNGRKKHCGDVRHRRRELQGKIVNGWKFIKPLNAENKWQCQCLECQNLYEVSSASILNGGSKRCIKCAAGRVKIKKGDKKGSLTLLKEENEKCLCLCDCGKEVTVSRKNFIQVKTSCGPGCNFKSTFQNFKGKKFGMLTVLEFEGIDQKYHQSNWKCQCECGNIITTTRGLLTVGGKISCGCLSMSKNEYLIQNLLKENNINFIRECTFSDLKSDKNRSLFFDFYIENNYIIEFDGIQHFSAKMGGWNTEENLMQVRKHDLRKNKYCFENHIPLIRIPYNAEYTIDDLKLETTRFLLTPENEDAYYKGEIYYD